MKIGVLSDTHLPDSGEAMAFLHELAESCFRGVDMILHAGDLVAPELLAAFTFCPVHAVRGNMDPPTKGIPQQRIIECASRRIGLVHGWGPAEGLESRLLAEFRDSALDCLVFGHSHRPFCRTIDGVLLFNPGSATDRRRAPYHSVGLLDVDQAGVRGQIIRLD